MGKSQKNSGNGSLEKSPAAFCDITSLVRSPCCTILESVSDGVFTIDMEKRITSFNRAAEVITGFTREEAVGRFCFDVFRADICARYCALKKTLSGKEPQIDVSARIITRDGKEKPISRSTLWRKMKKLAITVPKSET